jgi:5-formyltetrahydrofolate cyclo-ligase
MQMTPDNLSAWRKSERARLIAARESIAPAVLDGWRRQMDAHLERAFPGLARAVLAFCWPVRAEYDARHLARALRAAGAVTALPVVVAPRQPLVFREWHPGVELAKGALGIPYPVGSPEVAPQAVLVPMNGWDGEGYRLGYGGGFFDRTLAAAADKPTVTERGVYRRDAGKLAFLGAPEPPGNGLASPVCYADERIARGD